MANQPTSTRESRAAPDLRQVRIGPGCLPAFEAPPHFWHPGVRSQGSFHSRRRQRPPALPLGSFGLGLYSPFGQRLPPQGSVRALGPSAEAVTGRTGVVGRWDPELARPPFGPSGCPSWCPPPCDCLSRRPRPPAQGRPPSDLAAPARSQELIFIQVRTAPAARSILYSLHAARL